MISGAAVLGVALGLIAFIWVAVLVGSQAFGSPPEH